LGGLKDGIYRYCRHITFIRPSNFIYTQKRR
jgi:hypothetical protein